MNLGLPTSYQDFLRYYLDRADNITSEAVIKLKEMIKKDLDQWSDLEISLGEATKDFKSSNDFALALRNIREALSKYLCHVDKLPIPNINQIAKHLVADLSDLKPMFDLPLRHRYENYLNNLGDKGKAEINVMTFNYTSTFERLMEVLPECMENERMSIKAPIHIHGTLSDGLMMGVNNVLQIDNQAFRNDREVTYLFVKPLINKEWDDGIDTLCRNMINEANVIILYGLSIGKTDRIWWEEIVSNVIHNSQVLVYSSYDKQQPTMRKDEILVQNDRLRRNLCRMMPTPSEAYDAFFNKILPIRQNRLFNFHLSENAHDNNFRKIYDELISTF